MRSCLRVPPCFNIKFSYFCFNLECTIYVLREIIYIIKIPINNISKN